MTKIGRKRIGAAQRADLKGLSMSEWDRQNIEFLIRFYEKAFPGVIDRVAHESRLDISTDRKLSALKTKNDSKLNMSRRMAIPNGLLMELKRAYPSIIVDKKQFEQFLRWFPVFDMSQV